MSAAVVPSPEQGDAKARLADAACQTEIFPTSAPLPLPMQYPANLVYAQSMLTICLGQLHHIDLCAMQLKMHLKERALQSAAAAVARVPPVATAAETAAAVQLDPVVESAASAPAAAAPEAAPAQAAQGAGAARQPEGEELERLQLLRRRLSAAVKVALVLMLLEVRYGWYFLYFFMVFLYIGGIFDPIIQRFQRQSAQMTLEQQLTAFRNERLRAGEVAAANAASAAAAASATGASSSTAAAAEAHTDATNTDTAKSSESAEVSDSNVGQKGQDSDGAAGVASGGLGDVGTRADTDDSHNIGSGGAVPQSSDTTGTTADPAADSGDDPNRPPWLHCFLYQLVVMFFGTLLPWWNPNPRYL